MKVTGFGDYMIHFSPAWDARFMQSDMMQLSFTGAEANVCAALGFWGEDTAFVTRLPEHLLAQKGVAFLRGLNIDTRHIATGDGRMGIYFLEKGASVRSSTVIYDRTPSAFSESAYEDYDWAAILAETDVLYISGITPCLSESLFDCCRQAMAAARQKNIRVVFDVNYRPALATPEKLREIFHVLAPSITHLICNEEHLKLLLQWEAPEEEAQIRLHALAARAKEATGIENIAITVRRTPSASDAVVYAAYSRGEEFVLSRRHSIHVTDRVGSGDAFSAGLIYGILHGLDARETVEFASAGSAMKHTIQSDINFASVEEIRAVMAGNRYDVKR